MNLNQLERAKFVRNCYGEVKHKHQIISPDREPRYSNDKTTKDGKNYRCLYCGDTISVQAV